MKTERVFIRMLGIPLGTMVIVRSLVVPNKWTRVGRVVYMDRSKFHDPYYTIQVGDHYYIRNESEVKLIDQGG